MKKLNRGGVFGYVTIYFESNRKAFDYYQSWEEEAYDLWDDRYPCGCCKCCGCDCWDDRGYEWEDDEDE